MSKGEIISIEKQFENVKKFITSAKAMEAIAMALPQHMTAEKMARVVITAITRTPKLLECTPQSIMQAVIEASQLGLMPDGVLGHGYILPYKTTAVFIPGYKGLLDLARRSGEIDWVQARLVFANDDFNYCYGADPTITHTPARARGEAPGDLIAAYGVAKFKTGEIYFEVMHLDEIEAIRQRSRAKDKGPWVTDYNEMARKTVIRRLCKFLPMNPEHQLMVARDEYAEAGVLGQYIDIDPATGEVVEQAKAPTSADMLNMFTDQMEEEGEEEKDEQIQDPRFEGESEPDDGGDKEGDAEADGEDEAQPDNEPVAVGDGEQEQEPVDSGEAGSEDDSGGPTLDQGSGRISKKEDAAFAAAIANMKVRMGKVQGDDLINRVVENRLKMFGARNILEIRQRLDREKFYRELSQMCEQWESMSQTEND